MSFSEAATRARKPEDVISKLAKGLRSNAKNDACLPLTTEAACNAVDDCVWCKAGAIPSSCFTTADAKRLPPAVFKCDPKTPSREGGAEGQPQPQPKGMRRLQEAEVDVHWANDDEGRRGIGMVRHDP